MTEQQAQRFWKEWTDFKARWAIEDVYVRTDETAVAQFADGSRIQIDAGELSIGDLKSRLAELEVPPAAEPFPRQAGGDIGCLCRTCGKASAVYLDQCSDCRHRASRADDARYLSRAMAE